MQTDGLKQVREVAKAMQSAVFADRETLEDAFNYMHQVASGCMRPDNLVSVLTAVHVVLNTAAKLIEKECNREIEAVFRAEIAEAERVYVHSQAYDPDPKQMAAANRLNQALFKGAWKQDFLNRASLGGRKGGPVYTYIRGRI